MYKALPDCLTIDKSKIHGLGLFATEDIDKGTSLGVSHIKNTSGKFEDNYIRTPLGGSINHSDDPNCIKYVPGMVVSPNIADSYPDYMSLKTIKNVRRGEELTVRYTLYSIEESDIHADPYYYGPISGMAQSLVVADEEGNLVKIERV